MVHCQQFQCTYVHVIHTFMQLEILEDWLTASNVREEIEMLQAVFCWLALYHTYMCAKSFLCQNSKIYKKCLMQKLKPPLA